MSRPPGPKLLLTVEEAARELSLGRSLLYELLLRGELRSVKVGRCRRIPRADLEAFVEELRAGSAAPESSERPEGNLRSR